MPLIQTIKATPAEVQTIARRISAANHAERIAKGAADIATDVFTMFCEGKGIPGATFVGIENGQVIVRVGESEQAAEVVEI